MGKKSRQKIASLKYEAGVSVASTKGKFEVYKKRSGKCVNSDFEEDWKEAVEKVLKSMRIKT